MSKRTNKEITIGLEKAPDSPTSIGLAGIGKQVLISFYWNPPEEPKKQIVLSRVTIDLDTAETLAKDIQEALKKSPTKPQITTEKK